MASLFEGRNIDEATIGPKYRVIRDFGMKKFIWCTTLESGSRCAINKEGGTL